MKISTLLFLCALALSGVAAYYSIVGLATIFSASFYAVIIMAGILEISKLVCASWLYQKWDQINGFIKAYLTAAVVALMLITSLGIFGFLSRAHVDQRLGNTDATLRIEQLDSQAQSVKDVIDRYKSQLAQLDRAINLQLDANRATQAMAARQRQIAERDQIRQKLDTEQQTLQQIEQQKLGLKQKLSVLESEVGPIKYVAEFFIQGDKVDVEKAVKWMIVVIVLVFDPLAVLMLIAANMSLMNERKKIADMQAQPAISHVPVQDSMLDIAPKDHLAGKIDLKYDFENRTLMYFDGKNWIPTELGLIKRHEDTRDKIDASSLIKNIEDVLEKNISQQFDKLSKIPEYKLDLDQIRQEVKTAMDSWLTAASNDVNSNTQARVTTVDGDADNATINEVTVTVTPSEISSPIGSANIDSNEATTTILKKPPSWI